MNTYREDEIAPNTGLKQAALWLLPIFVGALCLLAVNGLRHRAAQGDKASPGTDGVPTKNVSSSSRKSPSIPALGAVDSLRPIVGDWNRDGRDETGVYFATGGSGRFVVDYNNNGSPDAADRATVYGPRNVIPIAGDWDGNGRHQIGIFGAKGETGEFTLDSDDNGTWSLSDRTCDYGLASDTPIAGDWNGDGKDEVGNYRAAGETGQYILDTNGNGVWDPTDYTCSYGLATDIPIVGDWNGDGRDEVGNYRVSGDLGQFILDSNGNGVWDPTDRTFSYGLATDVPVIGDWNGDGRDEVGNYRVEGNCARFILDSNNSGSWEPTDVVRIYQPADGMTPGIEQSSPMICRDPGNPPELR